MQWMQSILCSDMDHKWRVGPPHAKPGLGQRETSFISRTPTSPRRFWFQPCKAKLNLHNHTPIIINGHNRTRAKIDIFSRYDIPITSGRTTVTAMYLLHSVLGLYRDGTLGKYGVNRPEPVEPWVVTQHSGGHRNALGGWGGSLIGFQTISAAGHPVLFQRRTAFRIII